MYGPGRERVAMAVRLEEADWETGGSSANKPGSQPPLLLSVIDAQMGEEAAGRGRGDRRWTSPDQSPKTKRSVGGSSRKRRPSLTLTQEGQSP